VWYARSCNGNANTSGATNAGVSGRTSVTQAPGAASDTPLISHQDRAPIASDHFVHVRHGFFKGHVLRCEHDDGDVLVDQRDRPVLEFSGSITLGVNVGYFLELERAFQRKRVVRPTADEQLSCGTSLFLLCQDALVCASIRPEASCTPPRFYVARGQGRPVETCFHTAESCRRTL
jgi:hypothetical protein